MATYVFVHGAWHGGWCWSRTAKLLRARGHDVFTPTLTGVGERAHLAGVRRKRRPPPWTTLRCAMRAPIHAGKVVQ